MSKGIDIYHGDLVNSFHEVAADGIDFVILKATQGLTGTDVTYSDRYARAKSVGLKVGSYHFFDPSSDPVQQAKHYLNNSNHSVGDIRRCLDIETYGPNVGANALEAAKYIKHVTGKYPIIYSSDSFYQDNLKAEFPEDDYILWIARYGASPVTKYTIWQDSESGSVQGVGGAVDTDLFHGSIEQLMAIVG